MAEHHKEFFRMMKEIKELLTPRVTSTTPKIRIGGRRDGSYVIADVKPDMCFSYGSNDDITFETGLYEKYSVPSRVFDHTIQGITNKPEYIDFVKEGLFTPEDLSRQTRDYTGMNALLKMDIEGSEWGVFCRNPDLSKYKQIVCELHFFTGEYRYYHEITSGLKNLTLNHVPIHVHGTKWPINPWLDLNFPRVLEVTFLHKSLVSDEIDLNGEYPSEIDWDFEDPLKFPVCSWWKSGIHRLE
jgi:hypothetical protein